MDDITNEQIKAPTKKKYTMTTYALQATHGLNNIVTIFVTTFLISYIYSIQLTKNIFI